MIEHQARRVIEGRLLVREIDKVTKEIEARAKAVELPKDLRTHVTVALSDSPRLSWDNAVADIVDQYLPKP